LTYSSVQGVGSLMSSTGYFWLSIEELELPKV
jgi:hypothetical protein